MMTKPLTDGEQEIWNEMQHDAVNHDESQCWEPCGQLGKSLEHARVVSNMSKSLIAKLATLVHYVDIQRRGRLMPTAELVVDRLLDDPEVAAWAEANKKNILYTLRHPR